MSSLVYLGFSVIIFLISYGLMFYLVPIILAPLYSLDTSSLDPDWALTQQQTEDVVRWIVPLVPTIGLAMLFIKVMMVASVQGRD